MVDGVRIADPVGGVGPVLAFNLGPMPATNRQVLQSVLQAATPGARAVFLNQVHGNGVLVLAPGMPDGAEADALSRVPEGLLGVFGAPVHAFDLVLTPERQLAREDAAVVFCVDDPARVGRPLWATVASRAS
mgnify:CR=1 FL=1